MFEVKRSGTGAAADWISLSASMICMVHCVALPLLLAVLPLLSADALESIWLEAGTLLVSLLAGGYAIWTGFRKKLLSAYWLWVFVISLLLMASANLIAQGEYEMTLKFIGAIGVTAAHVTNIRNRRHQCPTP